MKYLILILCLCTAPAMADIPPPLTFGNSFKMGMVGAGACSIWWEGSDLYGGCEKWDKWPSNWFLMVERLKNGTAAEREADYRSFGCTPMQADCSASLTPELIALFNDLYNATKPVTPPPVVYKVKANGAALTRPYYKANATMTGYGAKLGDVAVGTVCDGTKRLGTSLYYWVAAGGYALCALVP